MPSDGKLFMKGLIEIMKLSERLCRLLEVKSIITLVAAGIFAAMAFKGELGVEQVMLVVSMVFTYFFNRKEGA